MKTLSAVLLASSLISAGGCSWSSFDDLADETWVDSTGAAEGVVPNQFVAVAVPGTTGHNSVFVVLGRTTDSVGSYRYGTDGELATVGVDIRGGDGSGGGTQFGPLPATVPMAGDPYSNNVGVAAVTGAVNDGDTKVVSFAADNVDSIAAQNDFNDATGSNSPLDGPIQPSALVYARTDDDPVDLLTTDVALARGNQIAFVSDYDALDTPLSGCYGGTDADVVMTVAAGKLDLGDTEGAEDDELVAVVNDPSGSAPEIVIFDGRAIPAAWAANLNTLATCWLDGDPNRTPLLRLAGPAGDASFGAEMVVADFDGDDDLDLAIAAPAVDEVTAYINDGQLGFTEVAVGAPLDASGFGASMAAGDLDGDGTAELIVGAPRSNVGEESNAGLVTVYAFDGSDFAVELSLHDANAEAQQQFGTSVAVVPWTATGRNVLMVGGDEEIYTYFRTTLYDDVRGQ